MLVSISTVCHVLQEPILLLERQLARGKLTLDNIHIANHQSYMD